MCFGMLGFLFQLPTIGIACGKLQAFSQQFSFSFFFFFFFWGVKLTWCVHIWCYAASECSNPDHFLMGSIIPGDLFKLGGTKLLPPPLAPAPALGLGDIVDPPLPPVAAKSTVTSSNSSSSTAAAPSKDSSNAPTTAANVVGLSIISCLLLSFLCIRY